MSERIMEVYLDFRDPRCGESASFCEKEITSFKNLLDPVDEENLTQARARGDFFTFYRIVLSYCIHYLYNSIISDTDDICEILKVEIPPEFEKQSSALIGSITIVFDMLKSTLIGLCVKTKNIPF